jgi:hypothetical protein
MSFSSSERSAGEADIKPDGFVVLFMLLFFLLGGGVGYVRTVCLIA